jgi:hypothetical protein
MADTIVKKFVIDTTESEQNLKELNTQINATSTAVNNTAQSFDNVAAAENQATESSKSLKAQLRELQQQLAATDPKSEKYVELSQRAGELKDAIGDAAEAVGTQAGSAFERLGNSAGLLTGRLANLDFAGAAEGAKLFAQNITSIKFGDITNGIKSLGTTLASVGKALLTNPIFLIGAALAVAISYTSQFIAGLDGISEADQKNLAIQQEKAALAKKQVDSISAQENILRQQGVSERQILNLKIKALETAILEQEVVVQTTKTQAEAQIKAAERNFNYLKSFLDFVTLPQKKLTEFFFTFYNGAVDLLNKLPGIALDKVDVSKVTSTFDDVNKFLAEKIFNPAETKKDAEATVVAAQDALISLKNQKAGLELSITQQNKAALDKRVADAKAAADAQLKAAQELAAQEEALFDELLKSFEDAEQAKTDAALKEQQKRVAAAQQYYNELAQLQDAEFVAGLTAQEKEELAISQKYEKLIALAEEAGLDTTEITKKWQDELAAIVKAGADTDVQTTQNSEAEKVAIRQESFQKGLQLAQSAISVLQAFSDASTKNSERDARKKFKTDKALAIGAATVQTASAVTGALTAGGNPIKLATGQQFFEAAIAGALGLAQIIKIKNSTFGGTSTGGNDTPSTPPSVGGGGESQPAQFNPLAAQFINDRPEQLTPRAFVLAGDVASQQEVREKVQDLARLG